MSGRRIIASVLSAGALGAPVPSTDAYPMVEYWSAGDYRAHPMCEVGFGTDSIVEPKFKAQNYPFRRDAGIKAVADVLTSLYESEGMHKMTIQDLVYAGRIKKRTTDFTKLLAAGTATVVSESKKGSTVIPSMSDQLCSFWEDPALSTSAFCHAAGNFSQIATCLTSYEYEDPQAVLESLDPANDFGFTLSSECIDPLTAGRSTLGFELQTFTSTPDEISVSTARAEWRYYFLAWKALDHFNRYVEYKYVNEFLKRKATPTPSGPIDIDDLMTDGEVFQELLPEWKVERVFYSAEPKFMQGYTLRVPLAVLASRGRGTVIVFREAVNSYDGRISQYNQHQFTHLYNFTGAVHAGGATIYQALTSTILQSVALHYQELLDNPPTTDTVDVSSPIVTVIGAHQPMSSAAVILADQLERQVAPVFHNKFGLATGFKVQAITFGTPYIGNHDFSNRIRRFVENRHISLNSMKDFTCKTTYSCDERDLSARTGFITGVRYVYQKIPGQVPMDLTILKKEDPIWASEVLPLEVAALDRCGVPCLLASQACPSDQAAEYCHKASCENFVYV